MLKLIKAVLTVSVFVLVITFLCRAVIEHGFQVKMDPEYWYRDYLGNLAVTFVLALLVQSQRRTLILAGVIIVMFQLCNGAKLSILGTPASPDDFFNIQNFFFLTDGWRRIGLFFIASIPLILALAFMRWKRVSLWVTMACLALAGVAINVQSEPLRVALDRHIGNSVWNQPANFRERGLALHLAQETVRTVSKVEKPPGETAVSAALDSLAGAKSNQRTLEPGVAQALGNQPVAPERNVHVFVLESFFDPTSIGKQWVPEDPLPEDFRQLWQQTDHSTALSPVFGGYTANAEFEMLCGFPVTRNAVFFEGWLRRAAPCLPDTLTQAGYTTVASHPNVPGFWNRTHAYHLVGFDDYLSKGDFDLSDSIDNLLLDHSMYTQVFNRIEQDNNKGPVFNYMLTYHGHLPYPGGNTNYPDMVSAGQESGLLHGYLNQIWYKSRDLMQQLAIVRKEDPDALIVVFGDHLPFLGPNYGIYTEVWDLPKDRSDFTGEQLEQLTSTPLIVIDGKRGPLKLGKMPLYRLPSLVLSLLGIEESAAFDATLNPDGMRVRPVYGMHYTVTDTSTIPCTEDTNDTAPCNVSEPWLQQVKVLIGDIFTGEQFSLQR